MIAGSDKGRVWEVAGMSSVVADFKQFLVRGNLVALAVAFVMGAVFTALVKALISDFVTPMIALVVGKPNFGSLSFTVNSSHFRYGDFVSVLLTFLTTAAAVFFLIVKPYESWDAKRAKADPSLSSCPECTSTIPAAARRCPQCTAVLRGPE
jgi:large conductance mechanosensitive channel